MVCFSGLSGRQEISVCYRFATQSINGWFFSSFDGLVNLFGGVRLHARHDVRIEVESNTDCRVPEAFAGNLGMDPGRQELRGVGVPQVVETDMGQGGLADEPGPFVGQRSGLQRASIDLRDNEGIFIRPDTKLQLLLTLIRLVLSEFCNYGRG